MKKRPRHILASLFVLSLSTATGCTPPHISNQYFTGKSSAGKKVRSSPKSDLKFITFGPQQTRTAPSATLTDIVSHLPSSYGNTYYDSNLVTWGHETTHGINAHVRNNFNTTGRKANAFYVLNDRAVVVAEPRIVKSQVGPYVPTGLRASQFSLYIEGQPAWDAQPLYILDEFNAYTNGAVVAIDLHKNNLWTYGQQDVLAGIVEFVSYSLALGRAVKEKDSEYFQTYPQFAAYLGFAIERAMATYQSGKDIPEFKQAAQEELLKKLQTGDDGKELRAFAEDLFGRDWVDRVLLGSTIAPPTDTDLKSDEDKDDDSDGVPNRLDKCPDTVSGKKVWTYGDWIGCGEGEERS
jgi:hypothetical protein